MTSKGGVCVAPKALIPEILKAVGYTAHPPATLVVQEPDESGLDAYPRFFATCSLSLSSKGGMLEIISITRLLVQLGFGPQVERAAEGDEVHVATHTCVSWPPKSVSNVVGPMMVIQRSCLLRIWEKVCPTLPLTRFSLV